MSDGEIIRQQQQLKKRQSEQEPESINCLPKIRIGDLIMNKHHQHTVVGANGSTTHKHISIKSNLHFYRFVFRVDSIDKHIMQALHIWKYSINKGISTKQYNYQQLSSKLNQVCANFNVNIDKGQKEEINIIFSGICQDNKKQQFI